jgi:ABC-type nitrate/sulfonate/bicarbonate transport system permease component
MSTGTAAVLGKLGRSAATLLISAAALGLAWVAFLELFSVTPFVGKTPVDVWEYLFTLPRAAENRAQMVAGLWTTLRDAGTGFAAGLAAACLAAAAFVLFKPFEYAFMPIAMLLRSVPLIAMAPLLLLVFGRETAGVAAIGGIVVFFPALVNIVLGLRSASPQSLDLIRVSGGTTWTALRKVAIPTAVPHLFAAMRISVPGAMTGAMLAEWLATGQGLGGEIFRAIARASYSGVWTIVVLVTGASILLYTLVGAFETLVLARWRPE